MAADQGDALARQELTKLYSQIGDHLAALEVARAAASSGDGGPLDQLARAHASAGDLGTAFLCFREALDHEASEAMRVRVTSALAHLVLDDGGDPRQAIALLEPFVNAGDDYADRCLFDLYIRLNDRAAAAALAHDIAKSGQFQLLVELASEHAKAGRDEESLTLLEQAAEHGNHTALFNLAVRLDEEGSHARARELAERAAVLCPIDNARFDAIENLAMRRHEAHEHDHAAQLFRLAGDHGNGRALLNLAILRLHLGDLSAAEAAAVEAANHAQSGALDQLARIAAKRDTNQLGAELRQYGLNADGSAAEPW